MRRLVAMLFAVAAVATSCTSDPAPTPAEVVDFTAITDCRELEGLISAEVDRINSTADGDIVAAATARYQRIVDHRDAVC